MAIENGCAHYTRRARSRILVPPAQSHILVQTNIYARKNCIARSTFPPPSPVLASSKRRVSQERAWALANQASENSQPRTQYETKMSSLPSPFTRGAVIFP